MPGTVTGDMTRLVPGTVMGDMTRLVPGTVTGDMTKDNWMFSATGAGVSDG